MGKEKIVHIFEFLRHATISSGKSIIFSEHELKTLKSYLFSKSRVTKKKVIKKRATKKKTHKKRTKAELYNMRIKNLAKARRARKSKKRSK